MNPWSPWDSLRALQSQSYLYRSSKTWFAFSPCDICNDNAKPIAGQVASSWPQITVGYNCPRNHCIRHHHILEGKKIRFHLISPDSLINIQPLSTHPFNVLYDHIRSKHKARLLYTEVWWLSQGKALVWLLENWTSCLFHEIPFLWAWMMHRVWLFQFGCLADIFSKINNARLSLRRKQVIIFVANNKIWDFKRKFKY